MAVVNKEMMQYTRKRGKPGKLGRIQMNTRELEAWQEKYNDIHDRSIVYISALMKKIGNKIPWKIRYFWN